MCGHFYTVILHPHQLLVLYPLSVLLSPFVLCELWPAPSPAPSKLRLLTSLSSMIEVAVIACLVTVIQLPPEGIKSKLLRLDERNQMGFLIGGPLVLTVGTRQRFSNCKSWKIQEIRGLLPSMLLTVDMSTVDTWLKIENMLVSSGNVISPWHCFKKC